jgi:hypothetical protein
MGKSEGMRLAWHIPHMKITSNRTFNPKKIKVRNYFEYVSLDGRIILREFLGRTNSLLSPDMARITQKTKTLGGEAYRHTDNMIS